MPTIFVRVVGRRQKWNFGHGRRRRCGYELAEHAPFTWQVIIGVTFEPDSAVRAATTRLIANGFFYTIGMPRVPADGPDTVYLMHDYETVRSKPEIRVELCGTRLELVAAVPPLPDMSAVGEQCALCNSGVQADDYVAACGHWFHTACVCAQLDANGDVGFPCPACGDAVEDVVDSYRGH